ncbi:MAG: PqqD family peptide modification chaperone [Chitinivibrionales bacterium]|nr:PqqD family peptide modification chaperone [Chitinivibrionales bacterium]
MCYKIKDNLSEKSLQDELFILDRTNSHVHSFNESGKLIWACLRQNMPLDIIAAELTKEFDVDVEEARNDISDFIRMCESRGLLEICNKKQT